MENLMTVVDRLDELQASWVGRRECSSTRQRTGAIRMDVHVDGLWPLPRHMWWRFRKVAAFARLCVFGGLCVDTLTIGDWYTNGNFLLFVCLLTVFDDWYTVGTVLVDMWRLVHQWWFFAVLTCLLTVFDCFWRMVHCTNRQKHSKPLVYQSAQVYQDCTNSVPTVYQSSKTVKNSQKQSKQQKWPLVYQSSHVYQDCTNRVPAVYQNSQKTVKKVKNDHWCTNRYRSTKTVPTV